MIKINLIAQKRARKRDKGEETVTVGFLIVLLAGILIYFLVHRPLAGDIEGLQRVTNDLARENRDKARKEGGGTERHRENGQRKSKIRNVRPGPAAGQFFLSPPSSQTCL